MRTRKFTKYILHSTECVCGCVFLWVLPKLKICIKYTMPYIKHGLSFMYRTSNISVLNIEIHEQSFFNLFPFYDILPYYHHHRRHHRFIIFVWKFLRIIQAWTERKAERKSVLKCKSFEANLCYRWYFYLSYQSHKKELYYETILFRFHWFDKTHFVCWIVSDKFWNTHRYRNLYLCMVCVCMYVPLCII